jgi:hypothetical protein
LGIFDLNLKNTNMKKIKLLAMILFLGAIAVSCEKEGPAGPAGPSGPSGSSGANGTNGNANVTVYGFGETVFNAANLYWVSFEPAGLTNSKVDSSLIMAYYKTGAGASYPWYPTGDLGPNSTYQTKMFVYDLIPPSVEVRLYDPDGSNYSDVDVTWDTVRIFVIPANIFRTAQDDDVNFNDYQSVSSYFPQK